MIAPRSRRALETLHLAGLLALAVAAPLHAQGDVVIRGVNVVDVEHGTIVPRRTVVVHAGRIASISDASSSVPRGAVVIEGSGRYLMPGLWDMHMHFLPHGDVPVDVLPDSGTLELLLQSTRALYVANGVTGLRDMEGNLEVLRKWNANAAARGELVPRLLLTGGKLGLHAVLPNSPFPIRSADDVRVSVQQLKAAGAMHVKVQGLSEPMTREALQQCRAFDIPCAGHVPRYMPLAEFSAQGVRSVEHMFMLPENTATDPEELIALARQPERPGFFKRLAYKLGILERRDHTQLAVQRHDSASAARLFRGMAAHSTWVTPTLALSQMMYHVDPPDSIGKYDTYLLGPRDPGFGTETRTAAAVDYARHLQALEFRMVREMRDAGVPLLAGTDTPEQMAPGFALHVELELLVRAGLTTGEALRAATLEPARYLGAQDSLGTVAPGHVADLVLLHGNPLADIRATKAIEAVVLRGRVVQRRGLDSLLTLARTTTAALRRGAGAQPLSASAGPGARVAGKS